jgi:hypothetical protein
MNHLVSSQRTFPAAPGNRPTSAYFQDSREWARVVSNHRPLACEASALPLSYAPGKGTIVRRCRRSGRLRLDRLRRPRRRH